LRLRSKSRRLLWQAALLAGIVALGWWLAHNAGVNLSHRNLTFGFAFLSHPAGFDIPFHLPDWQSSDTYARALWICLVNTLLVSAMAVVTASGLGLLLGIMRLSPNWLARNAALVVVEAVRNTPQLIQLGFWYLGVLQTLPPLRQSIALPLGVSLNVRGLFLPSPVLAPGFAWTPWALALGILAAPLLWRRLGGWALLPPLVGALAFGLAVRGIDRPVLQGFSFTGGVVLPPELVALWLGLSVYASAFISEIIRGAIEAVPHGQHEAASALGLRPTPQLFLIVLPQALRIMVPPLTSQYLNIIKSSSLGAAIAYPELVQIFAGTVLNQSGRAIEVMVIVMGVYLAINLIVSALMNLLNSKIALKER
jgi:general L-amino acid transport system permease protein